MTKDRFSSFKKLRQGGSSFRGSLLPSSSSNGKHFGAAFFKGKTVVVQVDPLGNDNPILKIYSKQVEEAQNLLEEMKVGITHVKVLHSKIISSPFYEDDAKEELNKLTLTITKASNLFRIKLADIKTSIAKVAETDKIEDEERISRKLLEEGSLISAPTTGISAHVRIGEIQYSALLKSFMEMINDYQSEKGSHQDMCKVRLRRQLSITGKSLAEDEVDKMIEEGNFSVFQQDIFCQTEEARETLVLLEERHTELKKLEKDLEMLFSLMQEMAILLAEQGEVIDRIDKHVASAKEDVSDGKDKLEDALDNRRASQKKKIYLAGIIIAIILVLILIVYFTYGNNNDGAA